VSIESKYVEFKDMFRVPKKRIYQFEDWFSRIDEELAVIIDQLNYLLAVLSSVTYKSKPSIITVPQPVTSSAEMVPSLITAITVGKPVEIVKRGIVTITDNSTKSYYLSKDRDIVMIIAESGDIYWDTDVIQDSSPSLSEGSILIINLSKKVSKIWIKPKDGTCTTKIIEFKYSHE